MSGTVAASCSVTGNQNLARFTRHGAPIVTRPRHFAITVAVRLGDGPIALKAEPIEETQQSGCQTTSGIDPLATLGIDPPIWL
jgi:hypothetical protein